MAMAKKKVIREEKKDLTRLILAVSGIIGAILILIAILNAVNALNFSLKAGEEPINRAINFSVFAILVLIGPYGFYMNKKQKEIKAIERRLPDFLRDVAEAGRFGMTLADAIVVASSGRYGKLTPEIKKMAAQIEWGVTATEALKLFANRSDTPTVNRVCAIIIKSSDAGGDVADVLTMVAHDARERQLTEDERRIAMSTYLAVIYIAFFVFLFTILILNATFLPEMQKAGAEIGEQAAGGGFQLIEASTIPQIQLVFLMSAIVHAIGDGILAGVLDNGKVANGLRHSFIMLIIGFVMLSLV